VTIPFTDN